MLQTQGPDINAIIKKNRRNIGIATIKTEIAEIINTKLDKLQKDLKARDDKIVALEKENVALKTLLNNQAQAIEKIEVYARVDNLLIQGILVSYANILNQSLSSGYASADVSSPNDDKVFIDFCANQLDVLVSPGDISIYHRLPKTPKAVYPPLLVRFTNRKKLEILRAWKKLREAHSYIFLNEHLTKTASAVFAETRDWWRKK